MTTGRRVVVTGVGTVNALTTGGWPALAAVLASSRRSDAAAAATRTIPGDEFDGIVDASESRRLSRISRMAVAAARLALRDAGVEPRDDLGLVVGTELGDLRSTIEFADGYLARGAAGLSALLFPSTVMNTMAAATAIAVEARAASITLNAPGVAGELAIARAAAAVAGGRLDAALAGGVDQLDRIVHTIARGLGVETDTRGEGATFLVLETLDGARSRGARIIGEILGWSWRASSNGPHGSGASRAPGAIDRAFGMAACRVDAIGWVYSSASGTARAARLPHRPPSASLVPLVGRHAGLGAISVAAGAWTADVGLLPSVAAGGPPSGHTDVGHGRGLVHAAARAGSEVALVVTGAPC